MVVDDVLVLESDRLLDLLEKGGLAVPAKVLIHSDRLSDALTLEGVRMLELNHLMFLFDFLKDLLALTIGVATRVISLKVKSLVLLHELGNVAISEHVSILLLHHGDYQLDHLLEESFVLLQEHLSVDYNRAHELQVLAVDVVHGLIEPGYFLQSTREHLN